MSDKNKNKIGIIAAIAIVIVLWFLLRNSKRQNSVIIEKADGTEVTVPSLVVPDPVVNLPPLNYSPSTGTGINYYSSNGCGLCQIGYTILQLPIPAKQPEPEPQAYPAPITLAQQVVSPTPTLWGGTLSTAGNPPANWWGNNGSTIAGVIF